LRIRGQQRALEGGARGKQRDPQRRRTRTLPPPSSPTPARVAHTARTPRRLRMKPGSTTSRRAATPLVTELTATSSTILTIAAWPPHPTPV